MNALHCARPGPPYISPGAAVDAPSKDGLQDQQDQLQILKAKTEGHPKGGRVKALLLIDVEYAKEPRLELGREALAVVVKAVGLTVSRAQLGPEKI